METSTGQQTRPRYRRAVIRPSPRQIFWTSNWNRHNFQSWSSRQSGATCAFAVLDFEFGKWGLAILGWVRILWLAQSKINFQNFQIFQNLLVCNCCYSASERTCNFHRWNFGILHEQINLLLSIWSDFSGVFVPTLAIIPFTESKWFPFKRKIWITGRIRRQFHEKVYNEL